MIDHETIRQLYVSEKRALCAAAGAIVGDRILAEDIVHDAILGALQNSKSFDPARGSVRNWIYGNVRARALQRRRRRKIEIAYDDLLFGHEPGAAERIDLLFSLDQLPYLAALLCGHTQDEIARHFGVSRTVIAQRICRGLRALRAQLS